ncbi:glycosyltransferase family 9 protein [Vibrio astriarenae]
MKKVAVFVPHRAQFGNITTQIPMLYALKKQHPSVQITVYTKSNNSALLVNAGVADEVVNYKKWGIRKLVSNLNKGKYDTAFNVYSGSERVHFSVLLSNIKNKFAFSNSKLLDKCNLYTKHIFTEKGNQYIAFNNLDVVNAAMNTDFSTVIIRELGTKEVDNKTVLTLVPGGGAGDFKVWPIEKYCTAAKEIFDNSSKPISKISVVLGPQEQSKVEQIGQYLAGYPYELIQSPSIAQLVDLANSSVLTLSNDCGPCHIFQMLKVPMLLIWGWRHEGNLSRSPYHVLTEWYHCYEGSWCVFPTESEKLISTIPVERVASLALMQLSRA